LTHDQSSSHKPTSAVLAILSLDRQYKQLKNLAEGSLMPRITSNPKTTVLPVLVTLFALTSACADQQSSTSEPINRPQQQLPVSLNAIMVGLISYGANPLWVASWKPPESDSEWFAVERAATQLSLGSQLMSRPGTGPLDAQWTANARWQEHNQDLGEIAKQLQQAASARDGQAIGQLVDEMVVVCDACHSDFKLQLPTGGLFGKLSPAAKGFAD